MLSLISIVMYTHTNVVKGELSRWVLSPPQLKQKHQVAKGHLAVPLTWPWGLLGA